MFKPVLPTFARDSHASTVQDEPLYPAILLKIRSMIGWDVVKNPKALHVHMKQFVNSSSYLIKFY